MTILDFLFFVAFTSICIGMALAMGFGFLCVFMDIISPRQVIARLAVLGFGLCAAGLALILLLIPFFALRDMGVI